MDEISIVLASDDNYAQHGAVACASILPTTGGNGPSIFTILTTASAKRNRQALPQR